ncbi:hypothetical protein NEOLI_003019 [Neolecta irregularis DAH-3]|uniref:DNA endonuclease activator Ctp1 C-terminal domain-containing protein n=1 Tax=Neolecta irregularis (strain DAH-3) TaxID=1198029 RepID=A0A1U7LT70_NEOID|nr:hypothetical protein NEOLI_003019 [Neolecta irregularis DAH-3]|eukprot:OLL25844.1 hypothetical protein NEOLI_003019 [Neolecta irregularis DAH-3]
MIDTDTRPDELDTTDFIVNPARNNGINYAYHEVVRGKEARKALHAHDCPCCKTFYDIAGPPPPSMAPRWRSHSPESNDVIQKVSRHRVNFERAPTPPGFWNSEFPDTQAREEVRQQAEEMRRRRALEREAESKKFGGGRYIKR